LERLIASSKGLELKIGIKMERYYYGAFREEDGKVLVSVPDVAVCETFGDDWDDAFEMAIDALAACISAGSNNVSKRTGYKEMTAQYPDAKIMAVPVDEKIIESYKPKKRINVVFPADVLAKIDETRGRIGVRDRSKFITDGMREYTDKLQAGNH
jgi:predicted RNase H-like HicB family nuclease